MSGVNRAGKVPRSVEEPSLVALGTPWWLRGQGTDEFSELPVENGCVRLGALTLGSPAGSEGQIVLGGRPEDLRQTAPAKGFPFTLRVVEPLGFRVMLTAETSGQQIRVMVAPETSVRVGATMSLCPRGERIAWIDPISGAAIGHREAE